MQWVKTNTILKKGTWLRHLCLFRLAGRRKSWTAWTPSSPNRLLLTTILRWCRSSGLNCTTSTVRTAVCKTPTTSESWNVPWDRFSSMFIIKACCLGSAQFIHDKSLGFFVILLFFAQIVSSKTLTRPLVMKDRSPAGKGSITVSSASDAMGHLGCFLGVLCLVCLHVPCSLLCF